MKKKLITLPLATVKDLKKLAKYDGRSVKNYIEMAVIEHCKREIAANTHTLISETK